MSTQTQLHFTRQERVDAWVSRTFPKLSGRGHRMVLQVTRGRIANTKRGIPIGLLATIGARSGKRRVVPLMYYPDGDRYLVVAANAGLDRHPAWFHNLLARPDATFGVGSDEHEVRARVVEGAERSDLWPRMIAHNPLWAAFQARTSRLTPVVALEPRTEASRALRPASGFPEGV